MLLPSPHFSPDEQALALSLNPQRILIFRASCSPPFGSAELIKSVPDRFVRQKYTRLFRFFGRPLVNPDTCAIIFPTDEKCGLASLNIN